MEELCSFASGDKLLQPEHMSQFFFQLINDITWKSPTKISLCLVEIVGSSVVNIVAESGSNHGKGLEIRVILLQFTCLLKNRGDNPVL